MTTPTQMKFRVTTIGEGANGRITVGLVNSVQEDNGAYFTNNIALNLLPEEASSYFPGQTYAITLTPTEPDVTTGPVGPVLSSGPVTGPVVTP